MLFRSAERAPELASDVLVTYADAESDLAAFRADPLLGRIPAITAGRAMIAADKTQALGMSAPSPLSIPYALTTFVPGVAAAAGGA